MFKKQIIIVSWNCVLQPKVYLWANDLFSKSSARSDDSFLPQFKAQQHFLDQIQQLRNEEEKNKIFQCLILPNWLFPGQRFIA